ncbi:MAG: UbiA family prenyltransferase [Candidatus Odinarchaeota archaeon]
MSRNKWSMFLQILNSSRLEWSFIFGLAAFMIALVYRMNQAFLGFGPIFLTTMAHFSLNNLYDVNTDRFNLRKTSMRNPFIEENVILHSKHIHIWFGMLWLISWLIIAIAFYNSEIKVVVITIVMINSLLISIAYSVPPFRFKGRPVLDLISTSLTFGVLLPFFVGMIGSDIGANKLIFPVEFHIFILTIALAIITIIGMHFPTILIDLEFDKAAGDRTTAVWLGQELASTVSAFAVFLSVIGIGIILSLFMIWKFIEFSITGYVLGLIELFFAYRLWQRKDRESAMMVCKAIIVINSLGVLDYLRVNFLELRIAGL